MIFILSALWWKRIWGLWKLPDLRDWLRGKLDLVRMGVAMLSKSLIEFSVDGWSCVPSLRFTWVQTLVEVMKRMVTSFKRSHAGTAALSTPTLQLANIDPCIHWRLLDTHKQVWVSLLWGHCSFLLGPGVQASVCAHQEYISQSCVSSGSSMVGLMATFSKRAYAIP